MVNIKKVRIVKLDLDRECAKDLASGRGIRLQSVESFRKNEKVWDGLQSPFFGTDFSDEASFAERWRCSCGNYIGHSYEGQICPKCNTKVEFVDVDLTKFGWIITDNFTTLSPIFAAKLQSALGTFESDQVLNRIIEVNYDDPSYEKTAAQKEKEEEVKKKHPFMGKGMRWLSEHIHEVLTFYKEKKPGKKALFDELLLDSDKLFCHSIPVFSSVLRIETPGEKDKKIFKLRINTIFLALLRTSNEINAFGDPDELSEVELHEIDRHLYQMHKNILDLFQEDFDILDGKKGVMASRVIAGRYNFSSRMIISASSGVLRSNEIELCYISFLELFRYELINYYSQIVHCTIAEANTAWCRARSHFDEEFYNIMTWMCNERNDDLRVLINRNPSINFGSFMTMHVRSVKRDINDKTMRLNTRVIKTMGADFDGDQLNVYRIFSKKLADELDKCMDPKTNMYRTYVNNKVNKDMLPIKDEIVGAVLYYII